MTAIPLCVYVEVERPGVLAKTCKVACGSLVLDSDTLKWMSYDVEVASVTEPIETPFTSMFRTGAEPE